MSLAFHDTAADRAIRGVLATDPDRAWTTPEIAAVLGTRSTKRGHIRPWTTDDLRPALHRLASSGAVHRLDPAPGAKGFRWQLSLEG